MNAEEIRLAQLAPEEAAVVSSLSHTGALRRRLIELGLIEGTHVRCVLRAPSGSPIAYQVRGATIALRRCDAETILVRPWE